jgi:hypothetical protein
MAAATHDLPLWNVVEKINYSLMKPKLFKNVISNQAKYEAWGIIFCNTLPSAQHFQIILHLQRCMAKKAFRSEGEG